MKVSISPMEAKEFFPDVRRETSIMDFHCLKSAGKELRVKIAVRMPIGGGIPPKGTPEWVLEYYQTVVKDKAIARKVSCELEIEGATIETFSTPDSKTRNQLWNGCDFKQFSIERVGDDEKAVVYLSFVIYTKYTINQDAAKDTLIWLAKHMHASSFFAFDATQAAFTYPGEHTEKPKDDKQGNIFEQKQEGAAGGGPTLVVNGFDPNDDPTAPIAGDKRSVTKPTDKPKVKPGNKAAAKKAVAKKK